MITTHNIDETQSCKQGKCKHVIIRCLQDPENRGNKQVEVRWKKKNKNRSWQLKD